MKTRKEESSEFYDRNSWRWPEIWSESEPERPVLNPKRKRMKKTERISLSRRRGLKRGGAPLLKGIEICPWPARLGLRFHFWPYDMILTADPYFSELPVISDRHTWHRRWWSFGKHTWWCLRRWVCEFGFNVNLGWKTLCIWGWWGPGVRWWGLLRVITWTKISFCFSKMLDSRKQYTTPICHAWNRKWVPFCLLSSRDKSRCRILLCLPFLGFPPKTGVWIDRSELVSPRGIWVDR